MSTHVPVDARPAGTRAVPTLSQRGRQRPTTSKQSAEHEDSEQPVVRRSASTVQRTCRPSPHHGTCVQRRPVGTWYRQFRRHEHGSTRSTRNDAASETIGRLQHDRSSTADAAAASERQLSSSRRGSACSRFSQCLVSVERSTTAARRRATPGAHGHDAATWHAWWCGDRHRVFAARTATTAQTAFPELQPRTVAGTDAAETRKLWTTTAFLSQQFCFLICYSTTLVFYTF